MSNLEHHLESALKISSIISSNSRRKYESEINNFNRWPPNVKKEVNEPKGKLMIKEKKKQENEEGEQKENEENDTYHCGLTESLY